MSPNTVVTGLVPIGTVISWVGADPSTLQSQGWVACDGSWISDSGDGAALAEVIGPAFGHCEDTHGNTFTRLPDLRGMFIRGLATDSTQDPDGASRTGTPFAPPASYPNAAPTGPTSTGFAVGSLQPDCFAQHGHPSPQGMYGFFVDNANSDTTYNMGNDESNPGYGSSADPAVTGGSETRPKNVYVQYMIYAGIAVTVYPAIQPAA